MASTATDGPVHGTAVPDLGPAIEPAEEEPYDDTDSALGDGLQSSTTSIASSVLNYKYENGRRYHSFREGEYPLPNDEREQDRLDLLHHLQLLILDGKLYLAPISNPGRVLDVGTGTGIWAIDFADDHKSAEVIGIDLSPIQPLWVPPNVRFIVDDAESDWAYEANFDFVHIRSMAGSFRDMSKFFQQCFDHLNPQGWLEWKEFETVIRTDDDTFPPKSAYLELVDRMNEASEKFGRPMGLAPQIKTLMESAGFTNVSQKIFKVPLSPWPKDKKMKELGNWGQLATLESLQAYTLKLFTNVLGMEAVEAELLIKDAGTDVKDRSIHMYGSYYVVTGQKPKSA